MMFMGELCVLPWRIVPFGARANNHRLGRLSAKGPLAFPVFVLPWFCQERERDAFRGEGSGCRRKRRKAHQTAHGAFRGL